MSRIRERIAYRQHINRRAIADALLSHCLHEVQAFTSNQRQEAEAAKKELERTRAGSITIADGPAYPYGQMPGAKVLQIVIQPEAIRYGFAFLAGHSFADVGYFANNIAHQVADKVRRLVAETILPEKGA